ncbi:hypothetical protein EKO27_g83 [Xylaria grammica]|uniref:Uncharacterized protein n=1 Tax=Xylaria grammica TaxID=363999 RepID=A0A439DKU0_9PEZI|nr:hypothetical protein EKO27_g83 [Xylaria grammica]
MSLLYVETNELKPYWTLGIVVTGANYDVDSFYAFVFSPDDDDDDKPEDCAPAEVGCRAEPLNESIRPRALFELCPWVNFPDSETNIQKWLIHQKWNMAKKTARVEWDEIMAIGADLHLSPDELKLYREAYE